MAQNSAIEWTNATWNPIAGCSLVSPGCKNCYAMRMAARLAAMGQAKYIGTTKKVNGKATWTGKINLDSDSMELPTKRKKPTMYFVNSMSDLFHDGVLIGWLTHILDTVQQCPQHIFQVLTKRPERIAHMLYGNHSDSPDRSSWRYMEEGRVIPNLWLGFSAEDQKRFDQRWPHMKKLGAMGWLTWVSMEPMLGPITLPADAMWAGSGLKWVVPGGESGPDARAMDASWPRSVRDQCVAAGIPFFFKQWGEWHPNMGPRNTPSRVGKKAAGRKIDGREWSEFPIVQAV